MRSSAANNIGGTTAAHHRKRACEQVLHFQSSPSIHPGAALPRGRQLCPRSLHGACHPPHVLYMQRKFRDKSVHDLMRELAGCPSGKAFRKCTATGVRAGSHRPSLLEPLFPVWPYLSALPAIDHIKAKRAARQAPIQHSQSPNQPGWLSEPFPPAQRERETRETRPGVQGLPGGFLVAVTTDISRMSF